MSRYEHHFETKDALIEQLAQSILSHLQTGIDAKDSATLIVSGGSTPRPLFETLSQRDFPWEKVKIGLCDERWVETSREESNEHFVKQYLLKDKASNATFVGMYCAQTELDVAQKLCSKKMMEELLPFDVLILGMGSDAHTASLFPNNPKLDEAYDMENQESCIVIEPDTAPFTRMSLTLRAILSTEHLYVHFEGEEKVAVYQEALAGGDHYTMPIRAILHQENKDIEVYYR